MQDQPEPAGRKPGLPPRQRGYILILAGSVCISFAAFFVKEAPIDSSAVAFYRLLFGAAALFVIAVGQRIPLRPGRAILGVLAAAGVFFACDIIAWHKSILLIGPGISTIVANFEVILLAAYGVVFLGDRMSLPQKLSIPIALVGLALLLGVRESSLSGAIALGVGLALTSACFYAAYILTVRRSQLVADRLRPIASVAWVSVFAGAVVLSFCLATGVSLAIPDAKTLATVATLGIFCQSVGWVLLTSGLSFLPPFRAGLLMLTQPALSYAWDAMFFGASVRAANILGACLAIAAIGMGIYSPSREEISETGKGSAE